jgi:hypothetical protein
MTARQPRCVSMFFQRWLLVGAMTLVAGLVCGCGQSDDRAIGSVSTSSGISQPSEQFGSQSANPEQQRTEIVPASVTDATSLGSNSKGTEKAAAKTASDLGPSTSTNASGAQTTPTEQATANNRNPSDNVAPPEVQRQFKVEGPEKALRISYDDFDLLKVMNLDPVPKDAPDKLPKWLRALDGQRIRVRGFMYPPFQDTDIRGFVLARDNQICCFGRTPKEYDLVDVFMRKGVTTSYIQNRPFDVVGVFRIKSEVERFTAMYELEDAIVMEK